MAFTASTTMSRLFSLSSTTTTTAAIATTTRATSIATTFTPSKNLSSSFSLLPFKPKPYHPTPLRFSSTTTTPISAAIAVGSKLPDSTFSYLDAAGDVQTTTVADLTKSKKSIFFAVPGAFTPTCSQKHVPGFVAKSAELKAKGVDVIACISVNDAFVMDAWKKDLGVNDEVLMLSDGNGDFTRAIGAELDLRDKPVGLGVRSKRYAMLVEDGVVKVLNMEDGGAFTFSGAEDMLKLL